MAGANPYAPVRARDRATKMSEITFAGVKLHLPPGWADITGDLLEGTPATLARIDGVGALQLSIGTYKSGVKPKISVDDLRDMLTEFRTSRQLRDLNNWTEWASDYGFGVSAEFSNSEDWIKTWYVSDGQNVALVTYIASMGEAAISSEVAEADSIVRFVHW
jgi:hypothetical protein